MRSLKPRTLAAAVGLAAMPLAVAIAPAQAVEGATLGPFTTATTANGLPNNYVADVFVNGTNVYAATAYDGLGISTDGGATFTTRTMADGLGSTFLNAVVAVEDTVYVATIAGLSISTNGGTSFTNRAGGTVGLGRNSRDVVVVGTTVYVSTSQGLSISTDGGTTFTTKTFANGLGADSCYDVFVDGTKVYVTTTAGLSISTDGGATFTSRTTSDGLGGGDGAQVVADGSKVYVATPDGLSISTNGGASFTNKTTSDGLGVDYVQGVFVDGTTVYAATANGGLSISTNGGDSFTTTKTTSDGLGDSFLYGVFVDGATVYVATGGGLSIAQWTAPLTVTAKSTSIKYGASVPSIGFTTSPALAGSDWTTKPTCGVYRSSDKEFSTALTGVQAAGSYVTRCTGGEAAGYVPSYVKGSLTVTAVKPGAPTNVSGDAEGDHEATVSWTAPSSTGGAAITDYVVKASPGSASCSTKGAGRSCVVTGLTAGKDYTFTVTAKNSAGVSAPSSASAKVTALDLPGKVRSLTLTGVTPNGVVNLSWSAPADDGGSRITGYRVRYLKSGSASSEFVLYGDVKSTSVAVKGLPKGTYLFSIRAITAAGTGDFVVTTKGAKIS